jgi:hypothetical protein
MKIQTPKIKLISFLICMVILHTTACSNRIEITEYPANRETKLSGFSSYCWADETNPENALVKIEPTGGHNKLFDQNIRDDINADMSKKGYQKTKCANADFIIDYRMGFHEDVAAVDATTYDDETNRNYGPRWRIDDDSAVTYEGMVKPKEEIITVRHGTLHVAAFSASNQVLWHSSAEKTLNERDSDKTRHAIVRKAVGKIMATFPAKQ